MGVKLDPFLLDGMVMDENDAFPDLNRGSARVTQTP